MNQEAFYADIVSKLRSDTGVGSLVALTGHSSSDLRIARDQPPVKARMPFLGVKMLVSTPLEDEVSNFQRTNVEFRAYAASEKTCIQIADRVTNLISAKSLTHVTGYYDFSGTSISNRMTQFRSRSTTMFDEESDVWTQIVTAELIWVDVVP